jgi:hypothetical protein
MFTTQKTRLERQLTNLKTRLEKLDHDIKTLPAYQDRQVRWNQELQGLSEQEREAWFARRQLERDRERLMNLEMLELTAPAGNKSREYVELLRRERQREELEAQREWVQVQLQRVAHARQEATWFWICRKLRNFLCASPFGFSLAYMDISCGCVLGHGSAVSGAAHSPAEPAHSRRDGVRSGAKSGDAAKDPARARAKAGGGMALGINVGS